MKAEELLNEFKKGKKIEGVFFNTALSKRPIKARVTQVKAFFGEITVDITAENGKSIRYWMDEDEVLSFLEI